MWHHKQFKFEQFSVRGKSFDPMIFGIRSVNPPTSEHPYWEIDFEGGEKMITTEAVILQLRERKKEGLIVEEKKSTSMRIG